MMLIFLGYMIFVIVYRNKRIIEDVGLYKILLFTLGIILIYLSNIFESYSSYKGCCLKFILKHTGVITVLIIFYLYISMGYELGISKYTNKNDEEKVKMVKLISRNSLFSTNGNTTSKHSSYKNDRSSYYISSYINSNVLNNDINENEENNMIIENINIINNINNFNYNNNNSNNNNNNDNNNNNNNNNDEFL